MNSKTENERRFDNLCDQYRDRFHKAYGIIWGDQMPLSYHINVMEEALRSGVPVEIKGIDPHSGVVV